MSNKTESSLPHEPTPYLSSSPPLATQYSILPMDGDAPCSAPAEAQDPQQTSKPPRHTRMNSDETERPPSAQQRRGDLEEHPDVESDDESLAEAEADPAVQIADFDWENLHQRYHDCIKKCSQEEEALMQEWASLMEYFRIWASSGHEHETDRTFRRLQTRTLYVQDEEEALEEKRNHYVNVVKAFESALNLLKQNPMFRS